MVERKKGEVPMSQFVSNLSDFKSIAGHRLKFGFIPVCLILIGYFYMDRFELQANEQEFRAGRLLEEVCSFLSESVGRFRGKTFPPVVPTKEPVKP